MAHIYTQLFEFWKQFFSLKQVDEKHGFYFTLVIDILQSCSEVYYI